MLTLDINNDYLLLPKNFSVTMIYNNPACFFDKIPGNLGVNINLPINEVNRAILGNPEMFDKYSSGDDRKYSRASLRWGGVLLIAGTLEILDTGDNYSCWIQSDVGALGEDQQNKSMNELAWPVNQTFQDKTVYDDDSDDYGITPLLNRNFWEGKGAEDTVPMPVTNSDGNVSIVEETTSLLRKAAYDNYGWVVNDFNLNEIKDGCVISPFLHLRYVIKEVLRMNRFFIRINEMIPETDDSWLKNLRVYNNFNILSLQFERKEIEIEGMNIDDRTLEVNLIDKITGTTWELNTFNYSDLLPKKSVNEFFMGIQNFLNYIFIFGDNSFVDIIDRNELLSGEALDITTHKVGKWEIGKRKNVVLKFAQKYDKDDGKYSDEFKDLSDRWQEFGEPVETMEELYEIATPTLGELRLVKERNEIYEYKWKTVEQYEIPVLTDLLDALGWEFVSTGPQPYLYGKNEGKEIEEIQSAISTTQTKFRNTDAPLRIMPVVVQKGNIDSMRSLWNDFTIRLLPGNQEYFAKSLYFDGEEGLFKKRWEKWARFWRNRLEVNASFNFPLNTLRWVSENITKKFRTEEGEFIIETMQVDFKIDSIGITKIKGYKV